MCTLASLHPSVLASLGEAGAAAAVVCARPPAPWLAAAIAAGAQAATHEVREWPTVVVGARVARLYGRVIACDVTALATALAASGMSDEESRTVAAGAADVHVHVQRARSSDGSDGTYPTLFAAPYTDEHGAVHAAPSAADTMHQTVAQREAARALLHLPLLHVLGCATPLAQLVLCGARMRDVTTLYETTVAALGVFNAAQKSRMKHVEFCAEIILSLHQGDVLNKKAAVDRVMAAAAMPVVQLKKATAAAA